MNTKLFTNVVMVNSSADMVKKVLANPQQILQWVPEVSTVAKGDAGFTIKRNKTALNQSEFIQVESNNNQIIYTSTQGRLEYQLIFSLSEENKSTVIQEELYIPDTAGKHLPVQLLAPIAKHAFHTNLVNLASLVEMLTATEA
jgi:hypothetical protein